MGSVVKAELNEKALDRLIEVGKQIREAHKEHSTGRYQAAGRYISKALEEHSLLLLEMFETD